MGRASLGFFLDALIGFIGWNLMRQAHGEV
jgi:hypothetical protein